jgi:hypothetical protein
MSYVDFEVSWYYSSQRFRLGWSGGHLKNGSRQPKLGKDILLMIKDEFKLITSS